MKGKEALPKVISGSSSGAIMASIACTKKGSEQDDALKLMSIEINMLGEADGINSLVIIFYRRLRRLLNQGT